MKALVVLLAVVLLAGTAQAAEWTGVEVAKEAAVLALFAIDARQTMDIKNVPGLYEVNPVLGRFPSDVRVRNYFLTAALVHVGVAHALPTKYRNWLIDGTLALEVVVIGNNKRIGLSARF
jgi:hypothetical protein